MNKSPFEWANSAHYRTLLQQHLDSPSVRSLHSLTGGILTPAIRLTAEYDNLLLRTARVDPPRARQEDVMLGYQFLERFVNRRAKMWNARFAPGLFLEIHEVEWIVDDGQNLSCSTGLAHYDGRTLICFPEEMQFRGEEFWADLQLFRNEIRLIETPSRRR